MVTEPKIDKEQLKQELETQYEISINNLDFIPRGECSWGYKLSSDKGAFFLKIYATDEVSVEAFQLTYDLFEKCGITNIIHPQKSKNGFVRIKFQDYNIALFNFIEGVVSAETDLSSDQFEQLGMLMAKIHQSVEVLGAFVKKEDFELGDEDYLKVINSLRSDDNSNQMIQDMKNIISLHLPRIEKEYLELKNLQNKIKQHNIEFVNCHGDPTPSNIMLTPEGQIYLIDWDDPISAPKEKDLVFLHHRNSTVMSGYGSVTGSSELDKDVLSYYLHLWNIHEIGEYGALILDSVSEEETQRQHHFNELKHTLKDMGIMI